jgi:hypothetical protein
MAYWHCENEIEKRGVVEFLMIMGKKRIQYPEIKL